MMDIKDIQEQAFERGRKAGRREAIEERLVVLKGVEVKELVAKAETVLEDLYFCAEDGDCDLCVRYGSHDCPDELMRDAAAVIKALLCGGAEADVHATGREDTNVPTNCGSCGNYDREKGEFTQACGVCKVMNRHGEKAAPNEWKAMPMTNGVKEKLVKLLRDGIRCPSIVDSCVDCPHHTLANHCDAFSATADMLIANGVTVQEWIPVTERLPEKDGIYLTFNKKKQYEFHLFQSGKRMWQGIWEEDGVTNWMPLPEPPKGE